MKSFPTLSHFFEHAALYLILASLAIGAAGSLHQKITDRSAVYEVHTEHLSAVQTSGSLPVISMNELILPEIMPEYSRYRTIPNVR